MSCPNFFTGMNHVIHVMVVLKEQSGEIDRLVYLT